MPEEQSGYKECNKVKTRVVRGIVQERKEVRMEKDAVGESFHRQKCIIYGGRKIICLSINK